MKLLLTILISFFLLNSTGAQTTYEFMVTWKAANYAPPDYRGKVLPVDGTRVDIALEIIDGSRLADLSRNTIRWSIRGIVQKSGLGVKNFSAFVDANKDDLVVDISIPSYRGQPLDKRLVIPIARPEVAIEYLGNDTFRALPYFFNFTTPDQQAKFTWTVNGNSVEGTGPDPDLLILAGDIPSGTNLNVRVDIQNLLKQLEFASKSIQAITQ